MSTTVWPTRLISVASLHLDEKNPRLGREVTARAPREIIQYLFDNDKALEIAASITDRGFFPNEPLLAVEEDNRYVVIEGNRRLAALKALREPGLLNPTTRSKVDRLIKRFTDIQTIAKIPVTIAPTRRATDRQLVGRHMGTPVLGWRPENRASFILEKLAEGYNNDELRSQLGFTTADIQSARQTRAIADMARSIDLPEEVKAKLDNPKVGIFTTLERVFDSTAGRENLMVETDPEHGLRGLTTKQEFIKGFTKLVQDLALGNQSSRTLNTNDNIRDYFKSFNPTDLPQKKAGSFIPSDIIKGRSVASKAGASKVTKAKKGKRESKTVVPTDFKVRFGNDRLVDIRKELTRLNREDFPNAGAVLLRVFLELAVIDYLHRVGQYEELVDKLKGKNVQLPHGVPTMKHLTPEIIRIAKANLKTAEAKKVEKALRYDLSAPFTISDLHGFIHTTDIPSERDIQQFWLRTEPLFRLMLENDISITA